MKEKLHLSEDLFTLHEVFSPTMPDWLKGNILTNILRRRFPNTWRSVEKQRYQKKADQYQKHYDLKGLTSQAQYGKQLKGDEYISDQTLQGMEDKNIDLAAATFIQGPAPTKSTDPRMKAPNQAFILIEYNGKKQVYAPGLNDKDITIFPVSDKYAPSNTFKYAKFSDYKDYITDFYYVNTADPNNSNAGRKGVRAQQKETDKALRDAGLIPTPITLRKGRNTYDKSGYLINPDRYASALAEIRGKDYATKLEDAYNRLSSIRDIIAQYLTSAPLLTAPRFLENTWSYKSLSSNMESLQDAITKYNGVVATIDEAEGAYGVGTDKFNQVITNLFDGGDFHDLLERLNDLEETISDITPADFNW